ncbi:MAG: VWA domain-containing protein [Acidobacteria bacterium]|nr:VWA domain-containing protein [Acidobacteriota bacterium]
MAREIPPIIEEIRLRRGRRYAEGPRGRLWVKKMIRESLGHGGVPFSLPMKRRRPRRPRVALLVDVSHSVTRAAGYFLLICRGLAARLGRTEVHLFVDRVADATPAVRLWAGRRGGALDFRSFLSTLPGIDLQGASDYGRAFHQALGFVGRSSGRETVLVVLGDARSNHRDPLAWAFEELSGRCRRVLWLNPEPHALWNTGDSVMRVYEPACDVVCEARDLEGLTHGVRAILRSL